MSFEVRMRIAMGVRRSEAWISCSGNGGFGMEEFEGA